MAPEGNTSNNIEDESANIGMRNQFYGTMQSILRGVDITDAPMRITALHKEASELLFVKDSERSWNNAYRAEKILAHLRPISSLRFELEAQIGFLEKIGHDGWEAYKARFKQLFKNDLAELPEFESVKDAEAGKTQDPDQIDPNAETVVADESDEVIDTASTSTDVPVVDDQGDER